MENIVFYFSGTENSLKVAKDLSNELGNCEIISMSKPFDFTKKYDSIGFVYPTYFWGLPKKVIEFVENINLNDNKNAYYYSIATYGSSAGNAVYQLYELLLNKHGITLNYGDKLQMFSNYVVIYDMSEKINEIMKKSNEKLIPIINSIKMKRNNRVNKLTKVSNMDKDFTVNNNCTGCGICEQVCDVTQNRRRYTNPEINYKELHEYNNK